MSNFAQDFATWAKNGRMKDWTSRVDRRDALKTAIRAACRNIPFGTWITSAELSRRLFGEYREAPGVLAYFAGGASYLRKAGLLADCWEHGPVKANTFGHPSIKWKNPTKDPAAAGLEDIL